MPLISAIAFDKPAFCVDITPRRNFFLKIFHTILPAVLCSSTPILIGVCEFGVYLLC